MREAAVLGDVCDRSRQLMSLLVGAALGRAGIERHALSPEAKVRDDVMAEGDAWVRVKRMDEASLVQPDDHLHVRVGRRECQGAIGNAARQLGRECTWAQWCGPPPC